jgi:hypothetical protein
MSGWDADRSMRAKARYSPAYIIITLSTLLMTYLFTTNIVTGVVVLPQDWSLRPLFLGLTRLYVFKMLAATRIALLVFCTHSWANSAS